MAAPLSVLLRRPALVASALTLAALACKVAAPAAGTDTAPSAAPASAPSTSASLGASATPDAPASASAPEPSASAAPSAMTSASAVPPVVPSADVEANAWYGLGGPGPSGPATGGPRGTRKCRFMESVDTYQRSCTITAESDGSLRVVAKGTALNPDNGFEFTMHGGPDSFEVAGTLGAFGICKGPFRGTLVTILDAGRKTYDVRFREHCRIVIDGP